MNKKLEPLWENNLAYVKTVIDTASEPFLVLDDKFCVVAANDAYYKAFKSTKNEVAGKCLYDIGDGEWDIGVLRSKLEDVQKNSGFFNGLELSVRFKATGKKVLMLNGRKIYEDCVTTDEKPVKNRILLAMEDITEIMAVADKISSRLL